jgi:polar amino acid transport system substrate-binding protein
MRETGPDVTSQKRRPFIRFFTATAKAILFIALNCLAFLPLGCSAQAQTSKIEVFVPSLFDPHNRQVVPAAGAPKLLRFLTADDYPPFEFIGSDGNLSGYNIDVARAICEELKTTCTIQPRRWDNLLDALEAREGDAVIASLKETAETRQRAIFTSAYYLTPARFIALAKAWPIDARAIPIPGAAAAQDPATDGDMRPENLGKARIGVEGGSAHEAFLRAFFARSQVRTYPDRTALMAALREGAVDFVFGDAISLAIWMNDPKSEQCCVFRGGPFLEPAYFGEGVGMEVRPDDEDLRRRLNWALQRLDERGVMTELYLKYFPIGLY